MRKINSELGSIHAQALVPGRPAGDTSFKVKLNSGCCSALLTLLPALLFFFASSNCCGVWVHYLSCSTSLTSYSRIWLLTVACSIVPHPEVVLTSAASPVSILISEIELTSSDSFLSMAGLIDLSQTAKGFSTTIYKSTM